MFARSPEVMISLKAWTESLTGAVREGIETEYDKIVGASAKQALEAAVTKPGSTPEDFITVANTYPFAVSTRDAWGRAAMRAIDFGDVSAATGAFAAGQGAGVGKPSDAQKSLLDAIAKLSLPNGNAMQFATPWYGANPPATTKRVIPVLAGGTVFIATERGVMASKENGELLWQSTTQKVDPKSEPSIPGRAVRFSSPGRAVRFGRQASGCGCSASRQWHTVRLSSCVPRERRQATLDKRSRPRWARGRWCRPR